MDERAAEPAVGPVDADAPQSLDLLAYLERQRTFSERTFGPGRRTSAILDHIRTELAEIESNPTDPREWMDVVILGFDGAWRAGLSARQIVEALIWKLTKNEGRSWPDWRTADPDKPIEHLREPHEDTPTT